MGRILGLDSSQTEQNGDQSLKGVLEKEPSRQCLPTMRKLMLRQNYWVRKRRACMRAKRKNPRPSNGAPLFFFLILCFCKAEKCHYCVLLSWECNKQHSRLVSRQYQCLPGVFLNTMTRMCSCVNDFVLEDANLQIYAMFSIATEVLALLCFTMRTNFIWFIFPYFK